MLSTIKFLSVVGVAGWMLFGSHVEILLGLALASTSRWMPRIGLIVAVFFVAVFAGNINQYVQGIDAFGLNTDDARLIRLFFQPVLVAWALWSSNALKTFAKPGG